MKTCLALLALLIIGLTAATGVTVLASDTTYYNVDTTPPLVTIADSGPGAYITSYSPTVAISGTAEDDVSVTSLTWSTDRGASGSCTGSTSWVTAGIPLAAGDNVITVVASDAAGNIDADTLTVNYQSSVYPPLVVQIQNPPSSDSYSSSSDTVSIDGAASGGAGVQSVNWSTDKGYTGVCAGTTSWSADGITLVEGDNVITVTATDAVGQTATDVLLVAYSASGDTSLPEIAITNPTTDAIFATQTASIALQGTAVDNTSVASVAWANDRGGSGVCTGCDSWTTSTITLGEGQNVITITAKDPTGNVGTASLTVTYTPPPLKVAITTPSINPYSTHNPSVVLSGTISGGYGQYTASWSNDHGASGACTGAASWKATVPVAIGSNVITISARDADGRTASIALPVSCTDIATPSVQITSPATRGTYAATTRTLTVSGTASDNFGVASVAWSSDRGGSGVCTGTTSWKTASITLSNGVNVITVTAKDASGHSGVSSLTVNCTDIAAPSVQITVPTTSSAYSTTQSSINLGGTASDNFGVTSVSWSNDRGGNGVCTGTKSWTVSGIALQTGVNNITVTVQDASGNSATDKLAVTYAPVVPPSITILSPTANPTYAGSRRYVVIQGSASDTNGITDISWSIGSGLSGKCQVAASWSTNKISLKTGVNVITVTATSASGLTASDTITVTYGTALASSTSAADPMRTQLTAAQRQAQALMLAIAGPTLPTDGCVETKAPMATSAHAGASKTEEAS